MSPERPRAKFPPEDRPLPPVRTLRGEAEPVAAPSADPARPVRSGLTGDPLPLPESVELPEAMPLIPVVGEEPAAEPTDASIELPEPMPLIPAGGEEPAAEPTDALIELPEPTPLIPAGGEEPAAEPTDASIELPEAMPLIPAEPETVAGEAAGDVLSSLEIREEPTPELVESSAVDWSDPGAEVVPLGDLELGGDIPDESAAEVVPEALPAGDAVPDQDHPEIILHDEVYWVEEEESAAEGPAPHVSSEPVAGLTSVGDVGQPVQEPPPAVTPPTSWTDPDPETPDDLPSTEWEALGQPLGDSLSGPGEESVEEASEIAADAAELASRLERLAEQIRAGGSEALEAAEAEGDSVEAALAKTLAELLRRTD